MKHRDDPNVGTIKEDAKITMTNMLKDLEEKNSVSKDLNNMYGQMGNFSRDMKTIKERQTAIIKFLKDNFKFGEFL